ncbi:uncharacterized protein B0P05DRAFT_574878 [Gilbertella persicaria]|uniref:Uncharacterized protein n=1 Tax=Rhizopus stolonifer TaxID=4846 RepID=A0A367JDC8_RHIST|nr:uncharacterized protein B0P05DRAFT_574878 [Gilbertella persicaria]KAI8059384.1 hypothetical protein B0P05DRAFT_574878 [Gilbertella persicaria]RCH87943.1 hypothetical protein CU098_004764 [Rhizopus stolonifer]
MRAFSILSIALALFASANAAAVDKRAISSNVQTCVNDITAAGTQLTAVKSDVAGFTSAAGYSGALAIHTKEQALENLLKTATTSCCVQKTTVTDEEAAAVLNVISTLVPNIETTLSSLVSKKSQFDTILLATTLVKTDIKNLKTQTSALDTCLVAVTPSAYTTDANGYVTRVNAAFTSASTAYGI